VAYLFADRYQARGHVGRGYRAPSLYERFGRGLTPRLDTRRMVTRGWRQNDSIRRRRYRSSICKRTRTCLRTTSIRPAAGDAFATLTGPDPFGRFFGYYNSRGGISPADESLRSAPRDVEFFGELRLRDAAERSPVIPGIVRTLEIPRHQFSAAANVARRERMLLTSTRWNSEIIWGRCFRIL